MMREDGYAKAAADYIKSTEKIATIINTYLKGEQMVEWRRKADMYGGPWQNLTGVFHQWDFVNNEYRIGPKYQPYDTAELVKAMKKHGPVIMYTGTGRNFEISHSHCTIASFDCESIVLSGGNRITWKDLLKWSWSDDLKPCGTIVRTATRIKR